MLLQLPFSSCRCREGCGWWGLGTLGREPTGGASILVRTAPESGGHRGGYRVSKRRAQDVWDRENGGEGGCGLERAKQEREF